MLGAGFDTIVDSGLFHVFDDAARARYVAAVHAVLRPGGHLHLMCFSDRQPGDWGPRRVTEGELRAAFGSGWRIDSLAADRFDMNPGLVPRPPNHGSPTSFRWRPSRRDRVVWPGPGRSVGPTTFGRPVQPPGGPRARTLRRDPRNSSLPPVRLPATFPQVASQVVSYLDHHLTGLTHQRAARGHQISFGIQIPARDAHSRRWEGGRWRVCHIPGADHVNMM